MITCSAWAGRRYGVYGLARSGRAAAAALAASGAEVWPWDAAPAARADFPDAVDLDTADLSPLHALVVSPGVPLNTHPLAARAAAAGTPVIGDIELFADARPELPPHMVVGVTGTNGKSTTAALIHHIVAAAGVRTRLGGNIGVPILAEEPADCAVWVLELSSFQLDLTRSLACEIAVLLNVTPDHLDRYASFEAYAAAKRRLFAMQGDGAAAVIATDDPRTREAAAYVRARGIKLIEVSAARALLTGVSVVGGYALADGEPFDVQRHWPALPGRHNAQNAAAAIAACRQMSLGDDVIRAGLASYGGLPHRMEVVATRHRVRYVNDSKATNPESAAPALAAYPGVHWIVGGRAKGPELDACLPHLANVRRAYLIGEAAPLFRLVLEGRVPVTEARTLDRAVALASTMARPGETVLLAPAAASYDQFTDYQARGHAFRVLVETLP